MANILLEVCVDDVAGLQAAVAGGADRIELCSALELGGLTPSAGLMSMAAQSPVPCYAMIRPRGGNFRYSRAELDVMENDIRFAASSGLAGVVFGASLPGGQLDRDVLRSLSDVVEAMPRTLHRAFDLVPDLTEAIQIAIDLGFERILTSGRAASALKGIGDLKASVKSAAGRISIMPGSGINPENLEALLGELDVKEIHSSCSSTIDIDDAGIIDLGFSRPQVKRTSADIVRWMKASLFQRAP